MATYDYDYFVIGAGRCAVCSALSESAQFYFVYSVLSRIHKVKMCAAREVRKRRCAAVACDV